MFCRFFRNNMAWIEMLWVAPETRPMIVAQPLNIQRYRCQGPNARLFGVGKDGYQPRTREFRHRARYKGSYFGNIMTHMRSFHHGAIYWLQYCLNSPFQDSCLSQLIWFSSESSQLFFLFLGIGSERGATGTRCSLSESNSLQTRSIVLPT